MSRHFPKIDAAKSISLTSPRPSFLRASGALPTLSPLPRSYWRFIYLLRVSIIRHGEIKRARLDRFAEAVSTTSWHAMLLFRLRSESILSGRWTEDGFIGRLSSGRRLLLIFSLCAFACIGPRRGVPRQLVCLRRLYRRLLVKVKGNVHPVFMFIFIVQLCYKI